MKLLRKLAIQPACAAMLLVCTQALAAPAEVPAQHTEYFEQRYPLSEGGTFRLANVNGSVRIYAWEKPYAEVRASKTSAGPPGDIERVKIEVQAESHAVDVRTVYPQDEGLEVTVEYFIRVPRRVLLESVSTVNGSIFVEGIEGSGSLRSVNGSIEALACAGRLQGRTTNGNLRIELLALPGGAPIVFSTVNGSVVLALPERADAALEVVSMNGDFRSELPLMLRSAGTDREIQGSLGKGGSVVRIRTVNGGVRVVASRPTI